MNKLQYRSDIDGLRAIAVLSVVLYHAAPSAVPGGFVGVDVFFVISGYLITAIIVGSLRAGTFSLAEFYLRRMRRILPALFAMIAVTLAAAAIILLPLEFKGLARSAVAAVLSASNVWFWRERDYFSDAAEFEPLLHTWSLGVEEQFYLAIPLLLMLVAPLGRRFVLLSLLAIVAASLVLSVLVSGNRPGFAFYMIFTRSWELGAGGLLALYKLRLDRAPSRRAPLTGLAGFAGLAAVAAALVLIDDSLPFPGFAALAPVLGSVALIYAGLGPAGPVQRLLSLRPLVFVGLISYSWYLWHWPVLSLTRVLLNTVDLPPAIAGAGVALSFALAILSYRFIEQPARRKRGLFARPLGVLGAASAGILAVGVICTASEWTDGFPMRFAPEVVAVANVKHDAQVERHMRCEDLESATHACVAQGTPLFSEGGRFDVLLWGDSHARVLGPQFVAFFAARGLSAVVMSFDACPPLPGVERAGGSASYRSKCASHNAFVETMLRERDDMGAVYLHGRWAFYADGQRARFEAGDPTVLRFSDGAASDGIDNAAVLNAGLERLVSRLAETGRRVTLVGSVPEMGWDVPRAFARHLAWKIAMPPVPDRSTYATGDRSVGEAILGRVASSDPGSIHTVSIAEALCDPKCAPGRETSTFYIDDDHLSPAGAEHVLEVACRQVLWWREDPQCDGASFTGTPD